MTNNDDFTEAARAEILSRLGHEAQRLDGGKRIAAFLGGAEWGREHALAQEPTDAALVDLWWSICNDEWAVPEDVMVAFGRAVLSTARAARRDKEKR